MIISDYRSELNDYDVTNDNDNDRVNVNDQDVTI